MRLKENLSTAYDITKLSLQLIYEVIKIPCKEIKWQINKLLDKT